MKQRSTRALLGKKGLVAISRPPGGELDRPEDLVPLSIVSFRAEPELVERMNSHLEAWDRAGRPPTDALRISAYPKDQRAQVTPDARVLEKRWTTLVISCDRR
jgi:hypothetical protein